ncbi:TolC family protein, partial [bacterium]
MKLLKLILLQLIILGSICYAEQESHVLSMEQCINMSVENNLDIEKSLYDKKITDEAVKEVEAQYEPEFKSDAGRNSVELFSNTFEMDSFNAGLNKKFKYIGGSASLDWKRSKDDLMELYGGGLIPKYSTELSLTYTQPVLENYFGKNDRRLFNIVNLSSVIQQRTLELQRKIIKNAVKKAYLNMNFMIKNLEIQNTFLDRSKKLLRINKAKFKDGLIEEVDIISMEAAIKVREASLLLAQDG